LGAQALIRLKRNRKLYRPAPSRPPKQRGAPRKHGPLFQGSRPETYGPADAQWEGVDEHGKRLVVSCWKHLHFREAPQTEVSVIRVLREAAHDTKRDPRESWFLWLGQEDVPLEQVRTWYRKRFSQEHGYRFLKQDLLWTQAHLRAPQQVERWRWIVACACNQLLLAQPLIPRETRVGMLGTGKGRRLEVRAGRAARLDLHPDARLSQELPARSSMEPTAPVPPEQGTGASNAWMKQQAHPARLLGDTAVPLTGHAQRTLTKVADPSCIDETQAPIPSVRRSCA
jgi:Transposase DDE domain